MEIKTKEYVSKPKEEQKEEVKEEAKEEDSKVKQGENEVAAPDQAKEQFQVH